MSWDGFGLGLAVRVGIRVRLGPRPTTEILKDDMGEDVPGMIVEFAHVMQRTPTKSEGGGTVIPSGWGFCW